jgi:transposase
LKRVLSDEQEVDIARRYRAGETTGDIARALGRPTSTIAKALRRRGVKLRSVRQSRIFTVEREREVVRRYRQGVGAPTVARELGLNTSTVEALIKRRGILRPMNAYRGVPRPSRRKFTEYEEREIVRLYRRGFGTAEIGSRLGYGGNSRHSTVIRLLKRRGIQRRSVVEAQGGCPDRLFERVSALYAAGTPCREIARELGGEYSPDSVRSLLRRHGVNLRQGGEATRGQHRTGVLILSRAQQRAAVSQYLRGRSATEIAQRLGVNFTTIYRVLDAARVPRHNRLELGRPQEFAEIADLYTRKVLTIPQLARRFNTSPMILRSAFVRRRIPLYGYSEAQRVKSRQGFRPRIVSPPKRNTRIELRLQDALREVRIPFSPSAYVSHPALSNGGKEFDLALPNYVLVEIDGDWKRNPRHPAAASAQSVMAREAVAFAAMEKDGYKVLRFWGSDINKRISWVMERIRDELRSRGWVAS